MGEVRRFAACPLARVERIGQRSERPGRKAPDSHSAEFVFPAPALGGILGFPSADAVRPAADRCPFRSPRDTMKRQMKSNFRTEVALAICAAWLCVSACQSSTSPPTAGNNAGQDGGNNRQTVVLDAGPTTPQSPDGSQACVGNCNYQTQAGCGAGQMCAPQVDASNTPVSAQCSVAGTAAAGQACTWGQCQPGFICAADGYCRHLCCGGDWSVCEQNESCTGAVELLAPNSTTPVSAGVGICEPVDACDVFDPSTCPQGKSCYIVDSRGGLKCLPTGTADVDEACSGTQLCKAGLACVVGNENNATGKCRQLCRAVPGGGSPSCPDQDSMCMHFVRNPDGVGECTPLIAP